MQNTKISYMYRDASNYKVHEEVILEGTMTEEQWQKIREHLYDGEFFIPDVLGMEGLQWKLGEYDEEEDHCYHELTGYEPTDKRSCGTSVQTVEKFVETFLSMDQKKWEAEAYRKTEEMYR